MKLDLKDFNKNQNTNLDMKEGAENIKKLVGDTMTPFGKIANEYNKNIFETFGKAVADMTEQITANIIMPLRDAISKIKLPPLDIDFNSLKISMFKMFFNEFNEFVADLYDEAIFPPIYYIVEKDIKKEDIEVELNKWITSSPVKEYYLERIVGWKDNYTDRNILDLIDEIQSNLQADNYFSVCMLIFVLIEYMLRQKHFKGRGTVPYSEIRNVLEREVFEEIGINHMYKKFIKDNLYANTEVSTVVSRHMVHGVKLEFGTAETAMNMIFIYDFIQEVLDIRQTPELHTVGD